MPLILRPPTSRESLTETLGDLGRTRRTVAITTGILTLFGAIGGIVLLALVLDTWLGVPALLRGIVLIGVLTLAGILLTRSILPAFRLRTDSLDVALDLEERFPRLNDSLASAVSFLNQDERATNAVGSPRFRQAAVRRASKLSERYDFREVVPSGRCWQAFWCGVGVALLGTAFGMSAPQRVALAGVRLADPFGSHPWPPQTAISILLPDRFPARLATGDRFDLQFEIRGAVPEQATIHVEFDTGGGFMKTVPLAKDGDEPSTDRLIVASLDGGQLTSSFRFAITANDGDSGWQGVTVAPPPKLVPRDGRASPQIHAEFPAYTRLGAIDLPDGVGAIEAPFGTRLTLRAATDLRLSSAVITFLGDRSNLERTGALSPIGLLNPVAALGARLLAEAVDDDVPVAIGDDGHTLDVEFRPTMPGLYGLRLTDETGLVGTRLLEIRLQSDPAPLVVLNRPATGRDPVVFAPDAAFSLEATAEDRLFGIRRAFLEYRFAQEGPYRELRLHDGPAARTAAPAIGGGWLVAALPEPATVEAKRSVPVARFVHADGTPAREGDLLTIRAAADDWDDVSVQKSPGRSLEVDLRIASRDGIEAFLQKELAALRIDLLRLRNQQREARQKTDEAVPKLDGTLSPEDREKLLTAEQLQKQIQAKTSDARDGLRLKADQLRATVRANALPRNGTRVRIEAVAEELGRLADRDLPAIEPLLGEARQAGSVARPNGQKGVADLLARAGRYQQSAEDTLNGVLEQLEQWGSAGEIAGESRALRDALERQAGVPEGPPGTPATERQKQEREKAAGKLDQAADQASGLLAKAGRFAEEKSAAAAAAARLAETKEAEAQKALQGAAGAPRGPEAERAARVKVDALKAEAEAARQGAKQAADEAEALRAAIRAAEGQALPDDLRGAAAAVRGNKPGETAEAIRRSTDRLDELGNALTERPRGATGETPGLSDRQAADRVDGLAEAQDQLRKKVRAAAKIADPVARAEELKRLGREQNQLRAQAKDMLQKLTRRRADDATRDLRAAVDQMDAAREDLERGDLPARPQDEAIDKLEQARDRLDRAEAPSPRELSEEVRRKMTDQVRGLRDRQAAADKEAERIVTEALRNKAWPRPLQASLDDLAGRERTLAEDVRALADKRFDPLPVLKRLLHDSSSAMESASKRIGERLEDIVAADSNDAFDPAVETAAAGRFRRPMTLALRRLEQLLEALKPDEQTARNTEPAEDGNEPPPMAGGENAEAIPPLAQIKVLRSLQAELNERTAAFAKLHPNLDALKAEEQDELKELEQSQRDIASLFEEIAAMFQNRPEVP